jgi:UDP-N-acetyl-D-mannosaminuronate dehydrogenase
MDLKELIATRQARIAVIGLGYVGLPLLSAFNAAGFPVIGFDIDPIKIDQLRRGETYLHHLGEDLVARMCRSGRFEVLRPPRTSSGSGKPTRSAFAFRRPSGSMTSRI